MMVFVDDKKFACQSCIKGHRSSSCQHTERPLIEIKKKGRPVSQCDRCRELRKSRRVHSKCNCNPIETGPSTILVPPLASTSSNSLSTTLHVPMSMHQHRRFVPIAPALSSGIDSMESTSYRIISRPSARQLAPSLSHSCNCHTPQNCRCSTKLQPIPSGSKNRTPDRSPSPPQKRSKSLHTPTPGPDLPPIILAADPAGLAPIPFFADMPPISKISSFAGSGCTCGVECGCPGCSEHRGPEHVSKRHRNCGQGCGDCIDNQHGIALPGHDQIDSTTSSLINQFLRRAATIPAPPPNRRMSNLLDPSNVIVYPSTARETQNSARAFGLISLPKLECCGGNCGCPDGRCSCGNVCNGCCAEHAAPSEVVTAPVPVKSCCANKASAPLT